MKNENNSARSAAPAPMEAAFKLALGALALRDYDEAERIGKQYREAVAAPASDIAAAPEQQARCSCPSGDGDLAWPCPRHGAAAPGSATAGAAAPTIGEVFKSVGGWMNGGELGYPSFGSMEALEKFAIKSIRAYLAAQPAPAEVSPPDGAMPEPIYQVRRMPMHGADFDWRDVDKERYETHYESDDYNEKRIVYLAAQPAEGSAQVAMRDDKFTVIPQDMVEYQMSVREADAENDLFREAFEAAIKGENLTAEQQFFALDFFKDGWESAVRILAAPERSDTPWHDAVLAECMRVESCYKADDPVASLASLIDWHAHSSDTASTNKVLADNYIKLTCGSESTAASQALDAAPAGLEKTMIEQRIALTPENEGGWHAMRYGDSDEPTSRGYGLTPSEAVKQVQQAMARIDGDKQGAPDAPLIGKSEFDEKFDRALGAPDAGRAPNANS